MRLQGFDKKMEELFTLRLSNLYPMKLKTDFIKFFLYFMLEKYV